MGNICAKGGHDPKEANLYKDSLSFKDFKEFKKIEDIESHYEFKEVLGEGSFGQVRSAVHKRAGI